MRGLKQLVSNLSPIAIAAIVGTTGPIGAEILGQEFGTNGTVGGWVGPGIIILYCLVSQIRRWNNVMDIGQVKQVKSDIDLALKYKDEEERNVVLNSARDRLAKYVKA